MSNRSLIVLMLALALLCCLVFSCLVLIVAFGDVVIPAWPKPTGTPQASVFLNEVTPAPSVEPTITPYAACYDEMQDVIDSAEAQTYGAEPGVTGDVEEPTTEENLTMLVIYPVDGDQIGTPRYRSVPSDLVEMQKDSASQKATWALFTALIPIDHRKMVSEYILFTDGPDNILAAVGQSHDDPTRWTIEVDPADISNRSSLMFTLVHEYAHLLSLNSSQVNPDREIFQAPDDEDLYQRKMEACATYFTGEGCSQSDSYINEFYNRFWPMLMEDWLPVDGLSEDEDQEQYYEELYDFYLTYQDQFVDDYAATSPIEDFAESFSYFVFSARPELDSIANEKILFFYEFPQLVELRQQILEGLCEVTQ